MVGRRLTVGEAAEALGISANAVRMRVRRGSLASEKDEEGRVWVLVGPDEQETVSDQHATNQQTNHPTDELLAEKDDRIGDLQEQIRYLREENQRKDSIIMQMAQRIPELPPAAQEQSENRTESEAKPEPEPEPGSPASDRGRGFWSRIFGR